MAFKLVLAPSCDTVRRHGRIVNVVDVLVAHCVPTSRMVDKLGGITPAPIGGKKTDSARIRSRLLPTGFAGQFIPLPGFLGRIPTMCADLNPLQLMELCRIGNRSYDQYERLASIDSPHCELDSWACMQTAGRVGLPHGDFEPWIEELAQAIDAESTGTAG